MIIFLGAGASNPFGIPTMKEFVREFEKELKENNSNTEMSLYQDIRTILEKRYGANIDLEVVLTVLNDLNDSPLDLTAHYLSSKLEECIKLSENDEPFIDFKIASELKEDLIRYIKEKCSCDAEERKKVIKAYDELFKLLGTDVDIFTTNYDAYLEDVYFKSEGIPFVDGFSEVGWDPKIFNETKQPRLFKLHGSITWYLTEKDDLIKRDVVQGTKLSDGTEIKEHMLYPMRNKKRYEDPFSELYGRLRTGLQTTKFCMVIGYSFGDESIRNIFGRAMKEKPFMIDAREITIYDNFEDSEKYEGYAFRIKEFYTTEMDKYGDIMSDDPHGAVKIEYRNPRGDIDDIMLEKYGFETMENEANNSTIILTGMAYVDCSTFPILAGDELIGEYEKKECVSINMGKKNPRGLAVVLIDPCVDEIIDKHFKNLRSCIIPYALKFEKLSEIRSSEINKLTTSKK